METNIDTANTLFKNLLHQPAIQVELGHGSFITIGFGKELQIELTVRGKKEISTRPEWLLWVYMCTWQLEKDGEVITTSEEEREQIQSSISTLLNKKLLGFKILNDTYDMRLEFEDSLVLSLFANNDEEDNEQWLLYTPERKALVAGPMTQMSYAD